LATLVNTLLLPLLLLLPPLVVLVQLLDGAANDKKM
jgi:hypothetical protein